MFLLSTVGLFASGNNSSNGLLDPAIPPIPRGKSIGITFLKIFLATTIYGAIVPIAAQQMGPQPDPLPEQFLTVLLNCHAFPNRHVVWFGNDK